jgi:hypothetical protein
MEINADFTQRAVVHAANLEWVPSPVKGVERRMLDRIGEEVARATSIVRYAAGSHFSPHTHGGGEEYLVLEGVFQDEHGDFPNGSYVRNPPQSRHAPGSDAGCTIFVKLWQFDPDDRLQVHVADFGANLQKKTIAPGRTSAELFRDKRETVSIEEWAPGTRVSTVPDGGIEILCLEGGFNESGDNFVPQSWLRLPIGAPLDATAGPDGCRVWIKEGHLRFADTHRPQS